MIQYPLVFKVQSHTLSGTQTVWKASASPELPSLTLAIPPEFEGPGGGYSPEDLYAFALTNCFIATFKVIAEKSKLDYSTLDVQATLTVDRNEKGQPWMSKLHLIANLKGAQDIERCQRILEKTSQSCMILNSVNTVKTFEFNAES